MSVWHWTNAPFHCVPLSIPHELGHTYGVANGNGTLFATVKDKAAAEKLIDTWNYEAALYCMRDMP